MPNGSAQPQMLPAPKKKVWLWVILGILVLVVLILLFVYSVPSTVEEVVSPAVDSVEAIEQDLGAVDLEGLDAELTDIEKELSQ